VRGNARISHNGGEWISRREVIMIQNFVLVISYLGVLLFGGCFGRDGAKPRVGVDANDTYIFVQLTDNHLGLNPKNSIVTERLVQAINNYETQHPIEFISITGDLVSDAKYDAALGDFRSIRSKSNYPVYVVAGNNEFDLHSAGKINSDGVERNAKTWKENFGEFNYCVDIRNVRFVFISLECLVYGVNIQGCDIYKWLDAKLNEARSCDKHIIIFTHTPVVKNYYEGKLTSPYREQEYERLKKLLNEYHVAAVIAGHFHFEELDMLGDVPVYVCPSSVDFECGRGRFRVYEYDADKNILKYKTFEIQ